MVYWENQLDKEGNKYEASFKDIHSSSFHYSMCEAKDNSLKKPLYF